MSKLMTPYGLVDLVTGEGMERIPVGAVIRKLSKMQRFGGYWYNALTVAQHSIAVHELIVREGDWGLTGGLYHDFSEYLTGDIPSPVIALSPHFKHAHDRLSSMFVSKVLGDHAICSEVADADSRIARAEMKALRFDGFTNLNDYFAEKVVALASSMDYEEVLSYYRSKGFNVVL